MSSSHPSPSSYSIPTNTRFSHSPSNPTPTRKLHRFLSISKLPSPKPPKKHRDMVWNDNSSDKSWQFADTADWQGYYSPGSPASNSTSHSYSPPPTNYQTQNYRPPPGNSARNSISSTQNNYTPSVTRDSAYAPIPLSSSASARLSMSSGTQKLGLNPWKNKRLLKEAQEREAQRATEQARREAAAKEERRRYEEALRKQHERHEAEILRQKEALADEKKAVAAAQAEKERERRLRQQQEDEARRAIENERLRAEAEEAEKRRRALLERERETKRRAEALRKLKANTPDALKALRDLIRHRYELDMEIWRLRDVRSADREVVEEKMERADAVLDEILAIVSYWDFGDGDTWTPAEWELASDVKQRLLGGEKRRWGENPPWEDADTLADGYRWDADEEYDYGFD
jgi:hypothetical protein